MIKISDKEIDVMATFCHHIYYVYFAYLLLTTDTDASKHRIFLSLIFVLKQLINFKTKMLIHESFIHSLIHSFIHSFTH